MTPILTIAPTHTVSSRRGDGVEIGGYGVPDC